MLDRARVLASLAAQDLVVHDVRGAAARGGVGMRQRAATGWAGAGLAILITVTASGCDHIRAAASAAGRCAIVALRSIRVGSQPAAMVITPDGKRGYVANANSRFVTPIRLATSTALPRVRVTTPGGGTEAIVASPDGTIVYAATETFTAGGRLIGRVVPIRAARGRPLRPIRAGHFPIGLAITPDGKTIYVLDWNPASGPGSVIPIRTATRAALPPIRAGPVDDIDDIVMAPDGRTVYVTNFDASTVTPIRTVGNRALKPIKVGGGPNQIAITPDGSMAYVTTDDGVTPIRLATGTHCAASRSKAGRSRSRSPRTAARPTSPG
jgi:YVTN family beta-propeller protein